MFGVFIHPRPAPRTRAVAEAMVQITARANVASQVLEAVAESREPAEAVEFKVRYRFAEYLRFTIPMAIRMKSRMRRAKG